jgi:CubicO group peptidase (beta-lactamase class C family)
MLTPLRRLAILVLAFATVTGVTAAPLPQAKPESVGLSSERLDRVGRLVERLQAENKIAGAVTLVARKGKLVRLEAQGLSDLEGKRAMRPDDIFAIASMTKPIATVAALMLVEEQKLLLSDPVDKFLPEFGDLKVAVAREGAPNGYALVAPTRKITIHDLLTHSAGFGAGSGPAAAAWRESMGNFTDKDGLETRMKALAKQPLIFQPGSEFLYGPSTDLLGRVMEVVTGQTLEVFFRERIFAPLGMNDTSFVVPPEKQGRVAVLYTGTDGSPLTRAQQRVTGRWLHSAGGGLYSTAPDYLRFCQMLLNGGQLDGKRLLSRRSIELMTAQHVESIPISFLRGQHFGLGVAVQKPNGESGLLSSPGTYGWSGAYNTYFRIDPKEQLVMVLMVEKSPANNLEIQYGFHNAVMQSVIE